MINLRRFFQKHPTWRHVSTVASGTVISQFIAVAFSPLITRLYGPENYGLQGVFVSVVALGATAATLAYPMAIVLPREDHDARSLAVLSVILGLLAACLGWAALGLFGPQLLALLKAEALGKLIFLVPVAVLGVALGSVINQWLIRKRAFSITARYTVASTLATSGGKLALGLFWPTALVLILTNYSGQLIGQILAYLGWRRSGRDQRTCQLAETAKSPIRKVARQYADFPLFRTPQNIVYSVSQNLPVLFLSGAFGATAAGQYAIANTVLAVPAGLIGQSLQTVLYPRLSAAIHEGEDVRSLIIRATLWLALAAAMPFVLVAVAGPFLFALVFGEQWETAGRYAQWLTPLLFMQTLNKPAVAAIPPLNLQGQSLLFELANTGARIAALYIGLQMTGSDVAAIAAFSVVGALAFAWRTVWVIHRSGQPRSRRAMRSG